MPPRKCVCGASRSVAVDGACPNNLCVACCAADLRGCKAVHHVVAAKAVKRALERRPPPAKRGRGGPSSRLRGGGDSDDEAAAATAPADPPSVQSAPAEAGPGSSAAAVAVAVSSERICASAPAGDPLARSGPLAFVARPPADVFMGIMQAWKSAVHWRVEDVPRVEAAFRALLSQVCSDEADLLARNVVASGEGVGRTYRYATLPDLLDTDARRVLGMALRAATSWGEKLIDILHAEALVTPGTAYLDQPVRTSAAAAALAQLRELQHEGCGPSSQVPEVDRLADNKDFVVVGLHLATIKPERLRAFLRVYVRGLGQEFAKLNSKALVGPATWQSSYGRAGPVVGGGFAAGVPRGSTSGRRRWRRQRSARSNGASGRTDAARPAGSGGVAAVARSTSGASGRQGPGSGRGPS